MKRRTSEIGRQQLNASSRTDFERNRHWPTEKSEIADRKIGLFPPHISASNQPNYRQGVTSVNWHFPPIGEPLASGSAAVTILPSLEEQS